jgi:hypothetical protein
METSSEVFLKVLVLRLAKVGRMGADLWSFGNEGWIHFATDKHKITRMDDKAMIEKV